MNFEPRTRVAVYRLSSSGEREPKPFRLVPAHLAFELFTSGHATILWSNRKSRKVFGLLSSSSETYTRLLSSAPRGTTFVYRERISTSPMGIYSHKRAIRHQFHVIPRGRAVAA